MSVHILPKGPVFGWASFHQANAPAIPSVENLPHTALTTSGRSAIFQALLQLQLPPQSAILVPTYHCPTMVAPVLLAGHKPVYFGIRADGLADLQSVDAGTAQQARAMLVSHYFGLVQSLHEVRAWCDANDIALIEDCAHCYFGQAGARPIGAWGDYCTASLSKFFPVPEAGLLGSAQHTIRPMLLAPQGLKAQIKGWVDVLETATRYRRLPGLNSVLACIFSLKRGEQSLTVSPPPPASSNAATMLAGCNMDRISCKPLAVSRLLQHLLPRSRVIARRHQNFDLYAQLLHHLPGSRLLAALPSTSVAPYVFPLWVADADRVYQALRQQGIAVFRWDQVWPGTPTLAQDVGMDWSQHVLQLLCHQDLGESDIRHSAQCVKRLLEATAPSSGNSRSTYITKMRPLIWKNLPATALGQSADLMADWDRLNAARGNLPFLSGQAMSIALQVFGLGNEQLLLGQANGQTCAMLLLANVGKLRWQTFQPSQIPLGAWVADADLPVDDMASSLLQSGAIKLGLSLSVTQIDTLYSPRSQDCANNRHDDYIATAWVDIVGSFDAYWAARGKNLRQNMRKQRNKLQTEGVAVEMRTWRGASDMAAAIARYGELEGRSWKAQEGTAIRPDNDQGRFYTALFQHAAEIGEAVVYEYLFDGKTVASNLCLQRAGTLVILKTTYDETIKAYSPAFLLNEEILQALFAGQQIKRLEYYGKVMEWHTRWTDNSRLLYHLTSFRHGMVKQLAQAIAARRVRQAPPEPEPQQVSPATHTA